MKSKRSKITIIFVVLLIICSGTIVSQSVEPELKEAPLDAYFGVFQKFFNEAVRQKFLNQDNVYLGEVPSPVDRSHVRNVPPPYPRDWYSTSYDLRTLNKLTPIRNQGNCGSCWTFATMASLESYGKPGNDWDFSEQDLNLNNGFDFGECNGGNHDMAAAYLARWSGPLSETAVPYPYSSSSAGFSRGAYLPEKHIQKIIFIPQRSDSLDNDTIKYFISTYGAVHVSFYYDSSYIDAGDLSFYNNVNTNTNHAVAAVGWDDDYSASNFRPDRQPPGNGAFLIRNSWGTGRHDGGYFWLSYYDTSFKPRASLCNAEDPDNYDTNYYYDPLGQVSSAGYSTTTAWGANIFTAQGNSSLKAAGFFTNDTNTAYEIYVYKGVTPGEPTSGTLEATATGSRTYPGYYTVTLTSPVSLTQGDLFSVVIKFTNSSYTWPVAIETAINGYSSGAVCYAGESFISSNGSSWTDAYTYDWNVCIKGFASSSYTISGTVSAAAAPVANVVMDGLPGDPLTNGSGFYTADVQSGWSGTVTPTLQGYTFTPPSTTYTGVNTNHTDDYTATTHYITVISPNGGENLNMGSIHDISWTSAGITGNVMIQYSVDGGSTWRWVTTSTENDGNYNWTVPNAPSNQCLVRVSEKDDDGGISDESDAVFTILSPISGSITVRSPNGGENWHCGSSQEITWGSTGDIGSVNIKYSHDNGVTWNEIVKSASNQGSYDWTVPYTPSDKCLVRVAASDGSNDSGPSDVSDQVFSIVPPTGPAIRVTTPNGGEQLTAGYRYTVTWQSFGYRDDVKIEYSTTGGDFWTEITRAATNDGRYDWTVPDEPSDLCLVRVSGAEGEPSDESDSIFSILSQATSDLRVVSPNGGESWEAGSGQTIKWSGAGQYEYVNIKFSKNNGVTWETIVQSTVNDGGHDWVVPAAVSEECLIRVTADSQGDPKPSDDSDALFSIVLPGQPTLKVITPNGGEQLPMGSRYSITWYGTGTREDVKIEYSTNAGDTWTGLIETTPNDGQYDWTVPAEQSDICLVRISEIDGDPVDVSDTVFSIVPPLSGDIVVSYPNGGESWTAGNIKEISWYGSAEINNVTIKYSHDNGSSWQTIVQTTPNDGSYDWTLPATPSDECLVQISANDGDPDPVPSDISDAVFSILKSSTGEFKVTSPNGGEAWEVGSIHPVTWTCSGTINSVMIEYSYNNGGTWSPVVSAVSNSGSYDWPIPYTVSAECLIRITANDGGGDPVPSDVSDEVFSIVLPTSPTIRVITPNGGEEAVIGSVYHITWFSTGFREPVEIEYTTDGGDTWQPIAETENDGEYDWTVPDESSQTCLVRISETSGTPVDVSDTVFSIVPPQSGVITVTAPNGGENLETGVSYDITWTSIGLDNIIIEYSVNNGLTWLYITATAGGSGSYAWTVPATPSENCLVRISGQGVDESSTDVSDAVFTIFDPAQFFIEVITPNGGESLTVDGEYFITWASAGVNDVLIEYSPSNGEQWIAIDTVSALGGRYTWVVPDTPSPDCLVRISDPATQKTDVSDALFTITPN